MQPDSLLSPLGLGRLLPPADAHFPPQEGPLPEWLTQRPPPRPSQWEESKAYRPSRELWQALELAIFLGEPLLVTGEPGCGKTQLAFYAARRLGLGEPEVFSVKAGAKARDLLYAFDTVAYFHAASRKESGTLNIRDFLTEGPFWRVVEAERPKVLLIDEIDKAPRDFPNDLLHELDQLRFTVPELGNETHPQRDLPHRPIVILTSNSEQRLPDAFLRRCVYYHIHLTEDFLKEVLEARAGGLGLGPGMQQLILKRFLQVRALELRKKPATAELLRWASALATLAGVDERTLAELPLSALPFRELLLKTREDVEEVQGARSR